MNRREGALPDVGTDDTDALKDSKEDRCLKVSSSRQTDGHKGPTGAKVVDCLRVAGWTRRGDDRGVGAESASDALDVCNEVLCFLEVYPSLGTEAEAEILLVFPGI